MVKSLVTRWCRAVNCGLTPSSARNFVKVLLANCTPLSVTNIFGVPNRAMTRSLKAFFRISAVAVRSGTSSTHSENFSKNNRSMLFPCFERGKVSTKSAQTISHGSSGICVHIIPAGFWICRLMSLKIPG